MSMLPLNNLHKMRDISDYLYGFAREVYRGKTQALAQGDEEVAQQVGKGKDIMSILSTFATPRDLLRISP